VIHAILLVALAFGPARTVPLEQTLQAMNLTVVSDNGTTVVAEALLDDPEALNPWVEEPTAPGHGWTQARVRLFLTGRNVTAEFARFGVPDAILLIPPAWTPVRSNGRLEALVEQHLAGTPYLSLPRFDRSEYAPAHRSLTDDPPFITDVPVSIDTNPEGNQNETTIGVAAGGITVGGWNDNRTGVYHVGFARSTDFGATWLPDTLMIDSAYSEDGDPVICVDDSGHIYYFWLSFKRSPSSGDIVLTKSTDGGATWGPILNVTPGSPSSLDDKPWATIDGDNVFLSWYEAYSSGSLKFKRSTDRGATWSSGIEVGRGGNGTYPFRGTDSTVYVGSGMQDLRLNKSTNMGATWQGQRTIITCPWYPGSTPWRMNNIPSFGTSLDRTRLYVVFADSRRANLQTDVFFSRSTDEGATWMTPVRLNDTPDPDTTKQFYPWLAVDPYDRLHAIWHDTRAGANRIAQYYAYSTDYGVNWSQNYRVSDTAVYASTFIGDYNACAADSFRVYGLWCDARTAPSNPDVFHSHAFHIAPGPTDAGVPAIVTPAGQVDSGTVVTPQSWVCNYGRDSVDVPVWFRISDTTGALSYEDSVTVILGPGDSVLVDFAEWIATPPDTYDLVSFTALAGDVNPTNDTATAATRVLPEVGIAAPQVPLAVALTQVRPNPVSGAAQVRFALPGPGRARLRLLDAGGRVAGTLVDRELAAGWYSVPLDATRLPAGVYLLRLETETTTLVRKLVLER
jgi:hypothetical protein